MKQHTVVCWDTQWTGATQVTYTQLITSVWVSHQEILTLLGKYDLMEELWHQILAYHLMFHWRGCGNHDSPLSQARNFPPRDASLRLVCFSKRQQIPPAIQEKILRSCISVLFTLGSFLRCNGSNSLTSWILNLTAVDLHASYKSNMGEVNSCLPPVPPWRVWVLQPGPLEPVQSYHPCQSWGDLSQHLMSFPDNLEVLKSCRII